MLYGYVQLNPKYYMVTPFVLLDSTRKKEKIQFYISYQRFLNLSKADRIRDHGACV